MPRRASSSLRSGVPSFSASASARRRASPRRVSEGGAGSSTTTPQSRRSPGSRRTARSPTRSGSGVPSRSRTTSPPNGRRCTSCDADPTCSSGRSGGACSTPAAGSSRTSTSMVGRHAPGVTSVEPRRIASTPSPLMFSATRAVPCASSTGCSSVCTPRTRTVQSACSSRSPRRTVPAGSVPVTTTPAPFTVKCRSTQSRTSASRSGCGTAESTSTNVVRKVSRPAPVRALTGTTGAPAREVRASSAAARSTIGAGSARSERVTATRPCRTPSACSAARCSAACGIHGSSAATTSSATGTGPTPASIVLMNRSWPGTSTNATSPTLHRSVHA